MGKLAIGIAVLLAVTSTAMGAGLAVTTEGNNFACDTLEALRWLNQRLKPTEQAEHFTTLGEMFDHGCYPMTRGWPATILSAGLDYVKIHVFPTDEPKPFIAFTVPDEVTPECALGILNVPPCNPKDKQMLNALRREQMNSKP
jgi:hypothetical protein